MRSFPFIVGIVAAGASACAFDSTGLTVPAQEPGPETTGASESESSLPTTDAAEPAFPTSTGDGGSTEAWIAGSETSTGAEGDETTASPAPMCGDGVVEGEEHCDDGFEDNADEELCTSNCHRAVCGDGHVQIANGEACDAGGLNVEDPGYGQCSSTCTWGPYCGDGVVQRDDGEECEPQDPRGEIDTCTDACMYESRIVFLTSVGLTGDLGGIGGADQTCNELVADLPAWTGTFRAWLLVDGQSLADRFPEYAGKQLGFNFVNAGGESLAKSFEELVQFGPASPIVYTELGIELPEAYVWTNITSAGVAAGGDCAQWTSVMGSGALVGYSGYVPDDGPDAQQWHDERRWTDLAGVTSSCGSHYPHLYCVQITD